MNRGHRDSRYALLGKRTSVLGHLRGGGHPPKGLGEVPSAFGASASIVLARGTGSAVRPGPGSRVREPPAPASGGAGLGGRPMNLPPPTGTTCFCGRLSWRPRRGLHHSQSSLHSHRRCRAREGWEKEGKCTGAGAGRPRGVMRQEALGTKTKASQAGTEGGAGGEEKGPRGLTAGSTGCVK